MNFSENWNELDKGMVEITEKDNPFTILVVDKENKEVIWKEFYKTKVECQENIKLMQYYNFNPDCFEFKIVAPI